jgi:two-component system OmpR family response regulator
VSAPPDADPPGLVIDDDLDTLTMTRLLLPEPLYEVIEAYDAFAGLREFYFRLPDIVLVDALLPLMSGLELCRVIKSPGAARPRWSSSRRPRRRKRSGGYRVGADAYLVEAVPCLQDLPTPPFSSGPENRQRASSAGAGL